ncbi:hypothetical protein [Ornithinibacillus contaminans]|uniref:hypothetical protein n=1 Tax=Ornithinibacillus contaminans TaxID=694055 RepID=UPI00064D8A50|nr:hypothetical protein [Ornithinibacillus contaminans]
MSWNLKVQYILLTGVLITGITFMGLAYKEWYIPSPFVCFIFGLISTALYVVHIAQQQYNRVKEISILFSIGLFANLFLSILIYGIWEWEVIFSKQSLFRFLMFLFLLTTVYLIVAYIRAKISYKKVKGNQRENNKWRVSNRRKEELESTDEVYLTLGTVYEKPDE